MRYLVALLLIITSSCLYSQQPTISFTIDDGVTDDMPGIPFPDWNEMILDHLEAANITAFFFVTGANKLDDKGRRLLESWDSKGHNIGNHTFNHPNYNRADISFEKFREQLLKTDTIISRYKNYSRVFRFPYLKEGNTREKIDSFRTCLKKNHYRNGHVTIDASDWYIDSRLRKRLRENPKADLSGFREYYLQHLLDRARYYEKLSYALNGRHIKHTLLLHHNLTTALFLGDVISMFKENGWVVTNAKDAFEDEIYRSTPTNVPAGESLIWALAKQSGKFEDQLRYPAEDSVYEKDAMDKKGL